MLNKPLKVYAWSLGCAKNRVDTERALGSLGVPVELVDKPEKARLVFINTCAFIESATRESLNAIFETLENVRKCKNRPLFAVAGCLPGRYDAGTLAAEIKEIDIWLNARAQQHWPRLLRDRLQLGGAASRDRLLVATSFAWLKISDGCQHACAYCAIPAIKGPLQSEPAAALLAEARKQVQAGARELVLVAQDSTAWGRDFASANIAGQQPRNFAQLLRALADIESLAWLRALYFYPHAVNAELLAAMAAIGAPLLPYFDLPFQHSEAAVLNKMRRPAGRSPRQCLEEIRKYFPKPALRATLMAGFPGETEADFLKMCDFVREAQFDHLGVFAFVAEDGTAAASMPEQLPNSEKQARRAELLRIQREISRHKLGEYVGQRLNVLVDECCDGLWPGLRKGRAWFQAPEADGAIYVSGEGVEPGKMINCEIVDAQDYDLSALA